VLTRRDRCLEYMRHFGGPSAARLPDTARVSTEHDISEAFHLVDAKQVGFLYPIGERTVYIFKLFLAISHPAPYQEITFRSSRHHLSQVSSWWQRCSDIHSQKRKLSPALTLGMAATKPVWRNSLHGGMARALTLTSPTCGSTGQPPMSRLKALGQCSDDLLI
jgi:hypothetical protein